VSLSQYQARPANGSTALRREGNHSERWQREFGAKRLVVDLKLLRGHAAEIAHVAAAINCRVAVQRLPPMVALGQANSILVTRHRREVQDDQHAAGTLFVLADERKHAAFMIGAVHPEETVEFVIALTECRFGEVKLVQIFDEPLRTAVIRNSLERPPDESSM